MESYQSDICRFTAMTMSPLHLVVNWPVSTILCKMDVVFSDVLFFVCKSFKRFDKSTILGTLSKFYHEDELCSAKSELCKYVAKLQSDALDTPDQTTPTIDAWSKFVNSKGAPIMRKANEPGQSRRLEADDVLNMIMLLDVQVELPKFVAEDLDRVPRDIATADGTTDSPLAEVGKLVMVALCNRADHYIFILFLSFFFLSFFFLA